MNREAGDFVRSIRLGDLLDAPVHRDPSGRPPRNLRIAHVLRRQAKIMIAVPLVGAGLVALAAVVVPPTYTATAQVQVEPTEAEIAAGLLASVVDTHITTMTSEARLRDVIASLPSGEEATLPPLDPEAGPLVAIRQSLHAFGRSVVAFVKNAIAPAKPEDAAAGSADGRAGGEGIGVGAVKAALLVRQERQSNVLSVSYRNSNPKQAALIANRIVTTHIEELQNRRRLEADRLRMLLEGRIEATRARLTEAEQAARSFYSARGAAAAPAPDANGAAALEQELAYVQAALERLTTSAPAGEDAGVGRSGSAADASRMGDRAHEIRLLTSQAAALQRQLEERRTVVGGLLGQQIDRQDVEARLASIRRLLEDLERRRDEVADRSRPYAASASIFALATVPARPSSHNPLLFIPPGIFAFSLLACLMALARERMDRSFRTARDVAQALGVPCLGGIPKPSAFRRSTGSRQAYERALGSIALGALHALGRRRSVSVILVTAAGTGAGSRGLAVGLAAAAAALGRRVLLVDLVSEGRSVSNYAFVGGSRTIDIGADGPDLVVRRDPAGAVDRLGVEEKDEVLRMLMGERLDRVLDKLSPDYDLLLVDGPPVTMSSEIRLLAARADEVIFALAWGRTRREAALDSLDDMREFAVLGGSSAPNVLAVLTDAPALYAA